MNGGHGGHVRKLVEAEQKQEVERVLILRHHKKGKLAQVLHRKEDLVWSNNVQVKYILIKLSFPKRTIRCPRRTILSFRRFKWREDNLR